MTVIANSSKTLSNVLIAAYRPELGYCVKTMKFTAAAAGSYKVGFAGLSIGGHVAVDAAGVDGILLEDITYAIGDEVTALMLVKGPATVREKGLILGAGILLPALKTKLEAKGIQFLA